MTFENKMKFIASAILLMAIFSCQKKPSLGLAADPLSPMAPPPMGANTYNDELKKELETLDELLNKKLDLKTVFQVKDALMKGQTQELFKKSLKKDYLAKGRGLLCTGESQRQPLPPATPRTLSAPTSSL